MGRARVVWVVLLVLGFGMCCFGFWRGEALTVLIKGSNICLECIGLG